LALRRTAHLDASLPVPANAHRRTWNAEGLRLCKAGPLVRGEREYRCRKHESAQISARPRQSDEPFAERAEND
jgi:hypothetical protein